MQNMRITIYYLLLLVLIALITGFLLNSNSNAMSMQAMITISCLLGGYVVGLSLVGEGKVTDEREAQHRYTANRYALVGGTVVISIGILFQIFTHSLDYWLLAGLISINLIKIASLIYSNYKH